MKTFLTFAAAISFSFGIVRIAGSEETANPPEKLLRLFNTDVFGHSTSDAVVLLKPKVSGAINPETVMVDIDDDRYIAATVTYPNEISFAEARRCLNSHYGKWEKPTFADDPTMGIWRNEDDQFAIQMTNNGDTLQMIYIKFSLVTHETLTKAFSEAAKEMGEESERAADSPAD